MISKQNRRLFLWALGLILCAVFVNPIPTSHAQSSQMFRGAARTARNMEIIDIVQSPRPFVTLPGIHVYVKKKLLIDPPSGSSYYVYRTARSGITNENGRLIVLLEQPYSTGAPGGDTYLYEVYLNPTDPGDLRQPCPNNPPTRDCWNFWADRGFDLWSDQDSRIHQYIIPENDDPYQEWTNE